jgi:hypothetical protein
MKVVVSMSLALVLAVYTCAMASNDSTNTSNNTNTPSTVNTPANTNTANGNWSNTNTTNNTNTSNNTNTRNKNNTWDNNTKVPNKNNKWNRSNKPSNTWTNTNTTNNTNTWNDSNTSTRELLKVSNDGFAAIRAIRAARVAIFNGQPTVATKMLNKATVDLKAATKTAPTFVAAAEATVNGKVVAGEVEVGKVNWIPIDGQVSLADTYVVTKEKNQHIQKANEHFKNGQSKQAIEELRLAAINVTCTRVMMPLSTTTHWVAEANRLIGQQKYYEANLALKAAEDGLVVNSASLMEMPQVKTENVRQTN